MYLYGNNNIFNMECFDGCNSSIFDIFYEYIESNIICCGNGINTLIKCRMHKSNIKTSINCIDIHNNINNTITVCDSMLI